MANEKYEQYHLCSPQVGIKANKTVFASTEMRTGYQMNRPSYLILSLGILVLDGYK
jgi:hypothetical protein